MKRLVMLELFLFHNNIISDYFNEYHNNVEKLIFKNIYIERDKDFTSCFNFLNIISRKSNFPVYNHFRDLYKS